MTRINCVPVSELCDQHLIAEYRELPRVFKLARTDAEIPSTYRMGKGHVSFFYDKLAYLWERWLTLKDEMQKRGFHVSSEHTSYVMSIAFVTKLNNLWNTWQPDQHALNTNRARLVVRMEGMRK